MAAQWSCLYQNGLQSLVKPCTNESLFCCHVTERQNRLNPIKVSGDPCIPGLHPDKQTCAASGVYRVSTDTVKSCGPGPEAGAGELLRPQFGVLGYAR